MPFPLKKFTKTKVLSISVVIAASVFLFGLNFSESGKKVLSVFLDDDSPTKFVYTKSDGVEQLVELPAKKPKQAALVKASAHYSEQISVADLPKNWSAELRKRAATFNHPNSDYWRKQVKAHEAQARTPGWLKFEGYTLAKNRDVLALPTFQQMAEAPRSDVILIVQLHDDAEVAEINPLGLTHEQKLGGQLISGLHRYRVENVHDFEQVLESVNAHSSVKYAEPDYTIQEALVPNEPNIGSTAWWLDQINAYEAWDTSTDATAIGPIAVFDNGILITHEDLADNLWTNPNEIDGNGIDDDGNGFIDDIHGITVSSGSMAHGTPVSGTICGQGNNAVGYVGSAWSCQLMELRSGLTFSGTVGDLAIALPYAIAEGSRISNHSWRIFTFSQMLADTVSAAETEGHLLVAAAGNEDNDIDAEAVNYPARLSNDNVLTIAASTTDESKISYSSWGGISVDIAAPTGFTTASVSGNYSTFGGTSQAAPVVTGAVALAWSLDPSLTFLEIKQLVMDSARPVAAWSGLTVTGGILDMQALLLSVNPDTDGDGLRNDVDPDDDNDGVLDEDDVFPLDSTEWLDTDGDGVGDNADVFPSDPSETVDGDGDGIGDNSDTDLDNDGIENMAENALPIASVNSTLTPILVAGGSASHTIDLTSIGSRIGGQVRVSDVVALGDLRDASDYFVMDINSGELISGNLTTGLQCDFQPSEVTPVFSEVVTVVDIGGGVPGIEVTVTVSPSVIPTCQMGTLALLYRFTVSNEVDMDVDLDGVSNLFDLDSDNDGVTDIIEAGLVDADNDGLVDNLADQGSVTVAPDDDGDGLPNHLDLESGNPLNDGTAYDIRIAGFGLLDTNGDGMINALDIGGGLDINNNGVDDLLDGALPQPDSDLDGYPDNIDAFPSDPTEWLDSDGDGVGDNADVFPNDASETIDTDADGTGDNSDIDIDNDGIANDSETPSFVDIVAWPVLGAGVSATGNDLVFSDGGSPFPRQANSVLFSTLGFTDQYQLSWRFNGDGGADYAAGLGLGITDSDANFSDVDYGFWFDGGWYGVAENGAYQDIWGTFVNDLTVFSLQVDGDEIRYLVDGVLLHTVTLSGGPDFYIDVSLIAGDINVNDFRVEPLGGFAGSTDEDGDGIDNMFDLDSDNDGICDLVEMGLADIDGNFMVDDLSLQGSITTPLDDDADGIPNHLDLESSNPANDGSAFDILSTSYSVLDSNGDGQINAGDFGGGNDVNGNGVDDLIEGVDSDSDFYPDLIDAFPNDAAEWRDSDGDGVGDNGDVFPTDSSEWLDSDGDGVGDNADAFPNDPTETLDSDGDGVGDNSDLFPLDSSEWADSDGDGTGNNSDIDSDNDGIADSAEFISEIAGSNWSSSSIINVTAGSTSQLVNLLRLGVQIGDPVTLVRVIARGDMGSTASESFSLDFNSGESVANNLSTGYSCSADFVMVAETPSVIVNAIDIGGGVPGIEILATAGADMENICQGEANVALEYYVEMARAATLPEKQYISAPITISASGGTVIQTLGLSGFAKVGSVVRVSNVLARGDLGSGSYEHFSLNFNSGETTTGLLRLRNGVDCDSTFEQVFGLGSGSSSELVKVIDVAGVPSIEVSATASFGVDSQCGSPTYAMQFLVNLTIEDVDNDGLSNHVDLDSDNDSIPDIIEVGLVDANGDFIVDDLADQGSILTPIDSDGDGIPDYLDLESNNRLNDGTAFDIATGGFASFDTNNDGMLNASDIGGGVDANNNGVDDLAELADTDGDGFPDAIDVFPADPTEWLDTDGDGVGDNGDVFPSDPSETLDSDGDGVGDNADAFPSDPSETLDSDGDGLGDNADAFPNDPTETDDSDGDGVGDNADVYPNDASESADSDGDGVGDNADAFPNDPTETLDGDGDGIGDNSDIDLDNDGLSNTAESSSSVDIVSWPVLGNGINATENNLSFSDGGSIYPRQANSVNFSAMGFSDEYEVSWQMTDLSSGYGVAAGLGDIDSGNSMADVDYGFWVDSGSYGIIESGNFPGIWGDIVEGVSVLKIEVDGTQLNYFVDDTLLRSVTISGSEDFYFDTSFIIGQVTLANLVIEPLGGGSSGNTDADNDGVDNMFDLDSDNDSIPDVVEAGLLDADGNFLLDDLAEQGSVSTAPDSDGDGIPDYLDLESLNPANDGTAFDILTGTFAGFDTNGDGQINAGDVGGGVDANANGVDDLIEP